MKVQERATAGLKGAGAAVGERLPSAPRERKPALAALAVLLILVGALGATVLVMRAGERIEVVKVKQRVTAGKKIPDSRDVIEPVMVAEDSAIKYVRWSDRSLLTKYRAVTDIVPGTLLVGSMLTGKEGLAEGKVVVGLSLKDGQYPQGLAEGDTVAVYRVGSDAQKGSGDKSSGGSGSTGSSGDKSSGSTGSVGNGNLLARTAKVQSVPSGSKDGFGGGGLPVTVVVAEAESAALTQAAAAGQVAVVKVPASAG
ncbi:hypothetical protein [Streptomyces telluris]|uniref:SAF domain-containing protein n=1 Tax=Streptomyces telluris TaxID=2720021 RepID=A0A9X2LDM2_9ACTN|nr:hypothetical protein [Streptomyces telluris]MCQ8769208.1 hypothetical protein [Streptomyces telluris]NJP81663.1 hypothetical protein [Streptomyces telluris]